VVACVEKINFHGVAVDGQQAGHGQSVASVVAGTGEDGDVGRCRPAPAYFASHGRGSSLHEGDGLDRFVLDGEGIQLAHVLYAEYFHAAV